MGNCRPDHADYILFKYTRALQSLRDKNPGYLESLILVEDGYEVRGKYRKKANEPMLYGHFLDVVDGFKLHVSLLDSSGDEAKEMRNGSAA